MTSVFVGAQEITLWIKTHSTEVSLKPESLYKSSKIDHFGKDLLKRWKVTSVTQAGSSQDLSENWKRTLLTQKLWEQEMYSEGSTLITGFTVVHLTRPVCPPEAGRQMCSKSYVIWMPRVQQQESQPWTRLFAQRPWDPQRLLFLYRGGTCLLSFLTESHVQTAIAINKGLNNHFEIVKALLSRDWLLHWPKYKNLKG